MVTLVDVVANLAALLLSPRVGTLNRWQYGETFLITIYADPIVVIGTESGEGSELANSRILSDTLRSETAGQTFITTVDELNNESALGYCNISNVEVTNKHALLKGTGKGDVQWYRVGQSLKHWNGKQRLQQGPHDCAVMAKRRIEE
ncbi:MAG: hypothetical protein Q9225_000346 [Loekoesia sp. 1 TL-2023]